jgi:uncharacterized repeat protein (TIGR03803 family)
MHVGMASAYAQTFAVIHNFTDGGDGAGPGSGLTMDSYGRLYGTTSAGGVGGHGTVFQLIQENGSWIVNPLYSFRGGDDGASPFAPVTIGPDGALYGTTLYGGGGPCSGGQNGCGIVYKLQPQASVCKAALCPWTETVLHRFSGSDGTNPWGAVTFDRVGNLYGTTFSGGNGGGGGTVYELMPSAGWAETVLYNFGFGSLNSPYDGLIWDNEGNLYGTVGGNGNDNGAVFELSPTESGWVANTLWSFQVAGDNGFTPRGSLIWDSAGNLYGTTNAGGSSRGGTAFELSPSGGAWTFALLGSFYGNYFTGPNGALTFDRHGNLYGVTYGGGIEGKGTAFELSPSGEVWFKTILHNFDGGADGGYMYGNVVIDAAGNIFGTTEGGGTYGSGVIWQITP